MTKILYFLAMIVAIGLLVSCFVSPVRAQTQNKHELECTYVNWGIYRCVNQEVICYKHGYGIQCKFLVTGI